MVFINFISVFKVKLYNFWRIKFGKLYDRTEKSRCPKCDAIKSNLNNSNLTRSIHDFQSLSISTITSNTLNDINDIQIISADDYNVSNEQKGLKLKLGHQINVMDPNINSRLLEIKKPPYKFGYSPPIFPGTGIQVCPNPTDNISVSTNATDSSLDRSETNSESSPQRYKSRKKKESLQGAPFNENFNEFMNPKINDNYLYTTYAVPSSTDEWQWILNHNIKIQKKFQRKYHCNVYLSNKPIKYKGSKAYMIVIESGSQQNILRCRSGLPNRLKSVLYDAPNAYQDIECYASEYLIKRKDIFPQIQLANDMVESSSNPEPTKKQKRIYKGIKHPKNRRSLNFKEWAKLKGTQHKALVAKEYRRRHN